MTLVVGAVFPWETLRRHQVFMLVAELGFEIQRGVILAADSRWTRPSGARQDDAVKMFQLDANKLAAYAGSVAAGEDAIQELSVRLRARTDLTADEMNSLTRQSLQTVWARYAVLGGQLHLLLAASAREGGCWLTRFSDDDGFCAHPVADMELVGPEPAKDHFRRMLGEIVEHELASRNYSLLPVSWANIVAMALYDTCEKQADALVGGKIMCGVTSAGEAKGQALYRLRPERMDLGAQQLTVDPQQAHTLRKWWKYRPPAGDSR